jgi:hypothetical protein
MTTPESSPPPEVSALRRRNRRLWLFLIPAIVITASIWLWLDVSMLQGEVAKRSILLGRLARASAAFDKIPSGTLTERLGSAALESELSEARAALG